MVRKKLQTVLVLIPMLFLCTRYLGAKNDQKECNYLFKYKIFDTQELSFQQSLQQVKDLRGYTKIFNRSIKRIHQDKSALLKYFRENRNFLTQDEIHGIYIMHHLLSYQTTPISLRLPSITMEAIGKIAWHIQQFNGKIEDSFAWDLKYLWERFVSVYAQLSEVNKTLYFTKKDKIRPKKKKTEYKNDRTKNIRHVKQPVVTTNLGGYTKKLNMLGGRFPLIAVWTHAIEYTDSIFLESVKDLYIKTPILSKIIPDFESIYINQNTDTLILPLTILKNYLIPYISSGIKEIIDRMNISEYVEFLKIVVGKKVLENFLIQDKDFLKDPRIFFISKNNFEFEKVKPLYDKILKEAYDLQAQSLSDIKAVLLLFNASKEITEILDIPQEINQELFSLIFAIDIWQIKTGSDPKEIINEIYDEFLTLDSFSRAYFIIYLLKTYKIQDRFKMLEIFSKRILQSSRDKINKRLIKELIVPELESFYNQSDSSSVDNPVLNGLKEEDEDDDDTDIDDGYTYNNKN